jgi:hypothetical protein
MEQHEGRENHGVFHRPYRYDDDDEEDSDEEPVSPYRLGDDEDSDEEPVSPYRLGDDDSEDSDEEDWPEEDEDKAEEDSPRNYRYDDDDDAEDSDEREFPGLFAFVFAILNLFKQILLLRPCQQLYAAGGAGSRTGYRRRCTFWSRR